MKGPRVRPVRLSLEVAPAVKERLDRLQQFTGAASMVEVIHNALDLYETLILERGLGTEFILRRPKGGDQQLILVTGRG